MIQIWFQNKFRQLRGIHRSQRPVTWSLDVSLDLRMNKCLSNRQAGDLRRHRTHYDVAVMSLPYNRCWFSISWFVKGVRNRQHTFVPLQWRHNERDGASNHQPHDYLLSRLFKAQVKEIIKAPRHWPVWGEFTGEFPAQRAATPKMFPFDDVIMRIIKKPQALYGILVNIGSGGVHKSLRALKNKSSWISPVNKIHIFQCVGKIFCEEFQRVPSKFHAKYLTHALKDTIFINRWKIKSSWI